MMARLKFELNIKVVLSLLTLSTCVFVVFTAWKFSTRNAFEWKRQLVVNRMDFDMRGDDVIVFLHIQKTGGTKFGLQLIKNLDIARPCRCFRETMHNGKKAAAETELKRRRVCQCHRPNSKKSWLFSRHHFGWPCGLHADWTEHHECVPKYMDKLEGKNPNRKFLYVTILREPVSRFLSEFGFVRTKARQWKAASLRCNGRSPSKKELPSCFSEGKNLSWITLERFMGCSSNLAFNRQTRMMADLTLVDCYDTSRMSLHDRARILLRSAITNLKEMAYFALVEYQEESQYLFEKMLGLKFINPFEKTMDTDAGKMSLKLDDSVLQRIADLNSLDVQFYAFAKDLFFDRVKYFKHLDNASK